jgi:Flp pilus assembly protein TadG
MVMNKLRNQSGSVLVFITFMIVLLLIMVGMGLDTGVLTYSRSMGQRAVDMAALSGAAGLAKQDSDAIASNIEQLNATNDYFKGSGNQIDGTVNPASGVGKNVTLMRYDFAKGELEPNAVPLTKANAIRVALETTNPYTGGSSNSAVSTPAFLTPLINLFGGGTSASGSNNVNVSAVSVIKGNPGLPIALAGCNPAWENQSAAPIPFQQTSSGKTSAVGIENSGWTTYLENATSTKSLLPMITAILNCQGTGTVGVGTPICLGNGSNTPVQNEFSKIVDATGNTCYLAPVVNEDARFNQCDNPIKAYASICPRAVCQSSKGQSYDPAGLCNFSNTAASTKNSIIAKVKSCNADPNEIGGTCVSLRLVRETKVGM